MKRNISILLAIVISLCLFSGVSADELSDTQKKLQDKQESLDKNRQERDKINKNISITADEIKNVDGLITSVSDKLSQLNSQIKVLDNEIKQVQEELVQCEEKLEKENQLLKGRLRAIYTSGGMGYIEVMLSSNGFSDFLHRLDTVQRIIEHDRKLEKSITSNKKIIGEKKQQLEKKKTNILALKNDAVAQKQQLDEKLKEKKTMMASLEKNKSSYEKMINQEESESKDLAAKIKALKDNTDKDKNGGGTSGGSTGGTPTNGKYYCVTGKPYRVTSPYGWRVHPVLGYKRFHAGMDLGVPSGTNIYALADGEVIYSGSMSGYGNVVMIDHGNIISVYAHNSSLLVKNGQKVKGGQLITYSGNTGLSSGPHLHFEIRLPSGGTTDPDPYYIR